MPQLTWYSRDSEIALLIEDGPQLLVPMDGKPQAVIAQLLYANPNDRLGRWICSQSSPSCTSILLLWLELTHWSFGLSILESQLTRLIFLWKTPYQMPGMMAFWMTVCVVAQCYSYRDIWMNTALRNKQLYDPVTKITAEKLQKFVLKKGVKETPLSNDRVLLP